MHTLQNLKCRWLEANIFSLNLGDAIAYFIFYILFPVVITCASLIPKQENITLVYSYLTVMISTMGIIYDAIGRISNLKMNKFKISIMISLNAILTIYCFF